MEKEKDYAMKPGLYFDNFTEETVSLIDDLGLCLDAHGHEVLEYVIDRVYKEGFLDGVKQSEWLHD